MFYKTAWMRDTMDYNIMDVKEGIVVPVKTFNIDFNKRTQEMFTSFAGVTPGHIDPELNVFEEIWNTDEDWVYQTKIYEHEEDGFNFKYRYLIHAQAFGESFEDDENFDQEHDIGVGLYLVLTPDSMDPEKLFEIAQCYGMEDNLDQVRCFEIQDYGEGVFLGGTEGMIRGEAWEGISYEEIPKMVNLISNCIDAIDGMRGFWLDRLQNQLGDTGWSKIHEVIKEQPVEE
jgi:hypothetical protein